MELAQADRFKGDQRRLIKDKAAQFGISAGGVMVLVALLLIFFYLLYVVSPTFQGASLELRQRVGLDNKPSLMLGGDESNTFAYRFAVDGKVSFYHLADGAEQVLPVALPDGSQIAATAQAQPANGALALGLNNGQVLVTAADFNVSYPNDIRTVEPALKYPLGEVPLVLSEAGEAISQLAFESAEDTTTFVWAGQDPQQLVLTRMEAEVNFMTDEVEWTQDSVELPRVTTAVDKLLITPDQRYLFLLSDNRVMVLDIQDTDAIAIYQVIEAAEANARITDIGLLAGASSLLVGNDNGVVSQWFVVNNNGERQFQRIRDFQVEGAVASITPEFFRKSFVVGTQEGGMVLLYATSERALLSETLAEGQAVVAGGFNPRSNGLVLQVGNELQSFELDNPHPEVSWSALWQKVWYEDYPEPQHVWQSTSGSDDFEAKLGLMPLAFGTLKAALYAMLFAVPLAIAGAIYTAYFMSPKVRSYVKPTVEIMEALPTVILGFLAGLWLAPLVEANLPGIMLMMVALPLTMLLAALGWHKLPEHIKTHPVGEFRELLLIPLLLLVGWAVMGLSPVVELHLMDGDSRRFVTDTLGITFDQRNALVVGMAMGFAVIPTIFSIAEDAVFSVPRHLVNGSLALGATQWQTLTRVVMLTASPGIFSAVMMGFGRAVGETMIVLMATGNTPLMEWNIFEGMRTLAANIAVEMPESAINSTHYRVLFLTAFVLFIFTFIFNTVAEFVRQRLRDKYSSL